ncbi:hypothetical protein T265_01229 [Opisthorchis viverrini]|uniref:Uncharacterized protein n=1 Tax=Opisthorchis viverrini TaxID=6198 RepID=A0A075A3B9_OPIVI|nr:hypothetical protein T265_01229 [Opisthorchis viverrini]KER32742.1 hypothetical protein T265_01229 [Opisthorchis viverrini]
MVVSMTKLKRKGERGQPCRTPLDVVNSGESFPFDSLAKSKKDSQVFHYQQNFKKASIWQQVTSLIVIIIIVG